MTVQLIDAMISLTALMEEESEKIARKAYVPELGEIATAKLRLTGRIEADFARLKRESANWAEKLDEESDASAVNQQILSRQIELSVEMMGAIAAEAQRLTGTRSTTYGACGGLGGMDAPAPISINARL
jgi:thiamine biosynthesis lipoprotein ApbE